MRIAQLKTTSKFSSNRMEELIGTLIHSSESYKLVRNQFLTTYMPNYLGNKKAVDRNIIDEGNMFSHTWSDILCWITIGRTGSLSRTPYL